METKLKIAMRLNKLAELSPADKIRAIVLTYLEAGWDAAREVARLANVPVTRAEHGGRYALVDDVELVDEQVEEVEEDFETAGDHVEVVEEEYTGRSFLMKAAPWSWI